MPRRSRLRLPRERTRAWRDKLRRQGLRPMQIWVHDVSSPEFAAEAHRQSLAIAQSEQAHHDQDFIDAISDFADGDSGKD